MNKLDALKFKWRLNLWRPLRASGVRVKNISPDGTAVDVEMKLKRSNRNHEKILFGGALSTMADPFFGLILVQKLGKEYFVVDRMAKIDFIRPGKGTVTAHFNISAERIAEIKKEADENDKVRAPFSIDIVDKKTGAVISHVDRIVHIQRRDKMRIK